MPEWTGDSHPSAPPDDDRHFDAPVLAEQVARAYQALPLGAAATLLNTILVFSVLHEVVTAQLALALWVAVLWAITALRIGLVLRFRAADDREHTAPLWLKRLLLTQVAIGAAWGSLAWLPQASASVPHETFVAFVLGGMTAGASATFSTVRHGYVAFALPALLPLMLQFLLAGDRLHYAMGAMILLFGVLLWRQSRHNYRADSTSLRLGFENRAMVERLAWAKDCAERLNTRLLAEIEAKRSAQDTLERHKRDLERIVAERTAELRHLNRELEEFAFVASHDLKAPLRAVANLAMVIEEDGAERLDDATREQLHLLRRRVADMDGLIAALLAYARLGQAEGAATPIALGPLLQDLLDQLSIPPGFRIEIEEPLPTLSANPVQLRQIFQNLITNAIAHHDRDRGLVRIAAADGGDRWLLRIADDGPGIPEHAKTGVFRMFSGSGKHGHSGIGLAVVRKLVLANGGDIEVKDNDPRGTVFVIAWRK